MIAFLLFFLSWVAETGGMSQFYFQNIGIVPPEACFAPVFGNNDYNNDTEPPPYGCPVFHDGLACWDPNSGVPSRDLVQGKNSDSSDGKYKAVHLFCPTVSHQLTTKVMTKYCGINGKWINPDGTNDRDFIDDAECYPEGIRPTAEERTKLNKLTTILQTPYAQCVLATNRNDTQEDPVVRFRNPGEKIDFLRFTYRFDGILCYPLSDQEIVQCPSNSEFFKPLLFQPNSSIEGQYGLGWNHCLRDEYKTLLTKFGLDKYFQQGCAAFENELISLPQTNFATRAYSPCSRAQKYVTILGQKQDRGSSSSLGYSSDRYDPNGKAIFFCNNLGIWEGGQDVINENKGCFSAAFKRFLDGIAAKQKSLACPAVIDDIFGQWPATPHGENATLSCTNVLKFFGLSTEQPQYYSSRNAASDVSRTCNEHGNWEEVDWLQCIPEHNRKSFLEDLDKWATRYRDM